jgi:hypothetical protein
VWQVTHSPIGKVVVCLDRAVLGGDEVILESGGVGCRHHFFVDLDSGGDLQKRNFKKRKFFKKENF